MGLQIISIHLTRMKTHGAPIAQGEPSEEDNNSCQGTSNGDIENDKDDDVLDDVERGQIEVCVNAHE